jgi:hypothetical protein
VTAEVDSPVHEEFRYFRPGPLPASGWWDRPGFLQSAQMCAGKVAGPVTMRIGAVTARDEEITVDYARYHSRRML